MCSTARLRRPNIDKLKNINNLKVFGIFKMLQAIDNTHDQQFIATELASPATLVAELAQPEVKNILLAYVFPSPMDLFSPPYSY